MIWTTREENKMIKKYAARAKNYVPKYVVHWPKVFNVFAGMYKAVDGTHIEKDSLRFYSLVHSPAVRSIVSFLYVATIYWISLKLNEHRKVLTDTRRFKHQRLQWGLSNISTKTVCFRWFQRAKLIYMLMQHYNISSL